jgi:hypothetical protein
MQALKILVIAMGVLIIAGIGVLGYGLSRGRPQPAARPGSAESAVASVFATQFPVPHGEKLEQISAAGDRVVLRFSSSDGDKLVLLDSHTGQLAGTVLLTPDSK